MSRPDEAPDADAAPVPAVKGEIDARGLLCPLPVLKARKRLNALAPGALLSVLTDDPAAVIDIPHFCGEAGHELVANTDLGHPARSWLIRRGANRVAPQDEPLR